jgi:hypothetical protein
MKQIYCIDHRCGIDLPKAADADDIDGGVFPATDGKYGNRKQSVIRLADATAAATDDESQTALAVTAA